MSKIELERLATDLAEITMMCTKLQMEKDKVDVLEKSHWAWLHIGFISGLKVFNPDFTDEVCDKIIELAQDKLK